jgi:hypothetical protein
VTPDHRFVPDVEAPPHEWHDACWCRPFATEVPDEFPPLTLVVHRSFPGGPVLEPMPGVLVAHANRAAERSPW